MTDYTWPSSLIPSATQWRLIANTAAFVSPLNGATRTLARGGDRWGCTLTFNALIGDDRATMLAFLTRLRGQAHRVVVGDHSYTRRGALTANFLVKGAGQTGVSLACDGAATTVTNAMRAGDWITLEGYLYMIVADVSSNGSGELTLTLNRPLVQSPANDATVNITAPTGRFLLVDNTVSWSNTPGGWPRIFSAFQVDLIEDLPT